MNLIRKKQKKDLLSTKQYEIIVKQRQQTLEADVWLKNQGIKAGSFKSIDPSLLKAQQAAHQLLTHHSELLTAEQRHALELFRQQIDNTRTRQKLKPQAAYPILNIQSKINRQLFKQHRHLQRQLGNN